MPNLDDIKDWAQNINPEVGRTVLRGLTGAGIGAAVTGGVAAMGAKEDPSHQHNIKGQALLGALMGGTAAAGLPLGMKMLGSGVSFKGESSKPVVGRAGDAIVGTALKHPLLLGLGGLAAYKGRNIKVWAQLRAALKHIDANPHLAKDKSRVRAAFDLMTENAGTSEALNPESFKNLGADQKTHHQSLAAERGITPGTRVRPGRLAAMPAALGIGYMGDKYLKGDY